MSDIDLKYLDIDTTGVEVLSDAQRPCLYFQQCSTTISQSIYISSLSVGAEYFGELSTHFYHVI